MTPMTHLGLFEGIGGFALAARWAGWHTPVMVEWNQYCQAVLNKNFPDATIFGDIRQFDGRPYAGQIDIITGGFPCQPYSTAGKRKGNDDDRALWPEMLRVIQEVAPAWVIGENVAGLLSMDCGRVFSGILADLEYAGYSTEIYLIPALGVGAPHRRDRVWIVAHNSSIGRSWWSDIERSKSPCGKWIGFDDSRINAYTNLQRFQKLQFAGQPGWPAFGTRCVNEGFANTCSRRCRQTHNYNNLCSRESHTYKPNWTEHWYEVATRICGMDDGVSAGLDGIGSVPAKATKGKAHRLEALGNAIVPQIAYQIFDAINQYHP